ncbi:MAG TPA: Gfo/Idh/MocA family oxidoreductase [Planctomycetota bacterium]|nr:Gfo/Idh/MocA family oxidoreductase [Planctomycetota bacterium]
MSQNELRVGLIGTQFMGKAHSNAWSQVNHFFNTPVKAKLAAVCGRNEERAKSVAATWGWQSVETDWHKLIARDDIDLIDICTPNNSHAEIAIAALKAGKHVACEKPLCMNMTEAKKIVAAAKAAKNQLTAVWYNYRRVPALSLARQLVQEGRIGKIFHVRAVYLQSWIIDPNFPAIWRLNADVAGTGSHGDLNAHIIDAARFISGEEITEVVADMETFVKERPTGAMIGGLSAATNKKGGKVEMAKISVDDAVIMLAKLSGGGVGTFEATRFAQGNKNGSKIEINGEKGAIKFEFEDMNWLEFYDASVKGREQGWIKISATTGEHPYTGAYWPAGHIIGYEHTFINEASDILTAIGSGDYKSMQPDFENAAKTQAVLQAASDSAKKHKWVKTGC